jgi:PLP dependent protein
MSDKYDYMARNIENVRKRIERAAQKSGRKAEDISLVAVSKTVDEERIMKALREGITDLGENRVQELLQKHEKLAGKCSWHLIGHLQTNKVKYIIDKVKLIHSVDSLKLMEEIDRRASGVGKIMDVLLQVNMSHEETKYGLESEELEKLLILAGKYANIKVRGLMTMAPFTHDIDEIRWVFIKMRKILIDIRGKNIDNISMDYLSMGMSNDFEAAIEEGSNMVRVGTAIFGQRDYN